MGQLDNWFIPLASMHFVIDCQKIVGPRPHLTLMRPGGISAIQGYADIIWHYPYDLLYD